jgi:hypothetical protein
VVAAYGFLRRSAGLEAASAHFRSSVPPQLRGPALMVMFSRGEYEGLLAEVGDPAGYGPQYAEFIWLQALIASLAHDGAAPAWAEPLRTHYAGPASPELYFAIGSFLQGALSQEQLLARIANADERCEVAYYLGLAARLRGDYPAATGWYQIAMQTGQEKNGEYHWAGDELFFWSRLGMENRHRLPRDDVRAVRGTPREVRLSDHGDQPFRSKVTKRFGAWLPVISV